MLLAIVALLAGIGLLAWGADRLVDGSSVIASKLGVPPLIIGLTIVALGTSAPEIFISIVASLNSQPSLAVGNALGSNIANIGLVLGSTALIRPMLVNSVTLKREYPILFFIMLFSLALMLDGNLSRLDGILLLAGLVCLVVMMISLAKSNSTKGVLQEEYAAEIPSKMSLPMASIWVVVGLILLPIASKLLVFGATVIAKALGVSDLVIGLTVVAIGTSLPELATSITCALKDEADMAVGNILGSNMFNLLAVLPFAGLIHPHKLQADVVSRDMSVMFVMTILLFFMSYGFKKPGRLSRLEGGVLFAGYIAYIIYLVVS